MMRKDRRKEIAKSVGVEMNFVCAIRLKKKKQQQRYSCVVVFFTNKFHT